MQMSVPHRSSANTDELEGSTKSQETIVCTMLHPETLH